MIIVRVPTPLRPYTEYNKEVELEAETVGKALDDLINRYPALKTHLCDEAGNLRPYINIFVNENDVRYLQHEATPLIEGDRLMILPSIAGGLGV